MAEDQAKALAFYTDVLGFVKQIDFSVGEYRWITVAAQLALEPYVNRHQGEDRPRDEVRGDRAAPCAMRERLRDI